MKFRGKYGFLSNFYSGPVFLEGVLFPTVEHAYVAAKTRDPGLRKEISRLPTPGQAKRFGRTLELRSDWEQVRVRIMQRLVEQKFLEPSLMYRLSRIEGPIVEENTWHDNFWGDCVCSACESKPGLNKLGQILTQIRDEENDEDL